MAEAEGKVLFITGAARGIGAATTREAVGRGYRVVLADIDGAAARELAPVRRSEVKPWLTMVA